ISPQFLIGVAIAVAGAYIRLASFREMEQMFTYELSIRRDHKLITTGPYSVVRHPSYTGSFMLHVGITLCELSSGTWWTSVGMAETWAGKAIATTWAALVCYSCLIFARAPREDMLLCKEFGKEWEKYAERVKFRFIPGVLCECFTYLGTKREAY
ncbi:hypothetical protein OF83DRAFT_1051467, partial [Amylostereum chailletii]